MGSQPASPKVRALQWLAQREHSRLELRGKLLRLLRPSPRAAAAADDEAAPEAGISDPAVEVEALLDWLAAHGYLSDQRFVESRVHTRQARFGNLRIRQELQRHGAALAPEAQQALRATEFDRALDVWRRKYGRNAGASTLAAASTAEAAGAEVAHSGARASREERAAQHARATAARLRQMRFLSSRGFSPEVIRRVLAQAPSADAISDETPDDDVDHLLGDRHAD